MSEFIDIINKSKITLIGYNSSTEYIKDELISSIPYFNLVNSNYSSFNIKSIIRDIKIENIINKVNLKVLVIDYHYIDKYRNGNSKFPFYSRFFNSIRDLESNMNIIVTSPTYLDLSNNGILYNVTSAGLYSSNLVLSINNNKLKVDKSTIQIKYENNYNK